MDQSNRSWSITKPRVGSGKGHLPAGTEPCPQLHSSWTRVDKTETVTGLSCWHCLGHLKARMVGTDHKRRIRLVPTVQDNSPLPWISLRERGTWALRQLCSLLTSTPESEYAEGLVLGPSF